MIFYYLNRISETCLFTLGLLCKKRIQNNNSDSPFFIVSAGRSGSTLLRKYLLESGNMNIPPESGDLIPTLIKGYIKVILCPWRIRIQKILSIIHKNQDVKIWNIDFDNFETEIHSLKDRDRNMAEIIKILYKHYGIQKGYKNVKLWGDKTPYLINRLSWIALVFPKAKIIHLVRDPRAIILSRIREFNDPMDYAIKRWKWAVNSIRRIRHKLNILEIKFEDFLIMPEDILNKILSFLSLGSKYKKMLNDVYLGDDHYKHHRNLKMPILKEKINEWAFLITEDERLYIEKELSDEMNTYGYSI